MEYQKYIEESIAYTTYLEQIEKLVKNNQTSGENQSIDLVEYTKLNLRRMRRLGKTIVIKDDLKEAATHCQTPMTWLVLTEAWCGDAAQNIPMINRLAELNDNIQLRLLFRDENPDLIDAFLTNGGRSIPKLIALKTSDLTLLGSGGPRPEDAQKRMNEFNQSSEIKKEDVIITKDSETPDDIAIPSVIYG
jgi:hypothetical protein